MDEDEAVGGFCMECRTHHDDLKACPKRPAAGAMRELLDEVAEQEENQKLNDRLDYARRHDHE